MMMMMMMLMIVMMMIMLSMIMVEMICDDYVADDDNDDGADAAMLETYRFLESKSQKIVTASFICT